MLSEFCAGLAGSTVHTKSHCGGRSLGKLPGSALRSTYVLHPCHSASETAERELGATGKITSNTRVVSLA